MKHIGYYAGFLSATAQQQISNAPIGALTDLLQSVGETLYHAALTDRDYDYQHLQGIGHQDLSARDQIALIRGLCDRIELKLMEEAK
jgi:hypothetical protein